MSHFGDVSVRPILSFACSLCLILTHRRETPAFTMPPARARIRYPTLVPPNRPSDKYGMTGYDALVSILGQVQSILDAIGLWSKDAPRKISIAERERFCVFIATRASTLTVFFDTTLPDPTLPNPYRKYGVYEEEARMLSLPFS